MRIIGGSHRGRKLATPPGTDTRPTSDKLRQAIFNILTHAAWSDLYWPETSVLDGFAGSGALGFEALSRGAGQAFFFDIAAPALACLKQNAKDLELGNKSRIVQTSALSPPPPPSRVNLVFLDPPYRQNLVVPALIGLERAEWLAPQCLAVIETARDENLAPPAGWTIHDQRPQGTSMIAFWQYGSGTA